MAALGADRPDRALEVVRWLEECSESLVCRWPRIAAHDGRASIAEREGDDASAEAHHRAALALHEGLDRPLERCLTLLGYGAFLRRAGRPVAARAHLGEALRLAEAAGAIPLAARVVAELAVAGGRRRRRDEPDALTAQERRVAQLAAEGLSNKEIGGRLYLSVKTVETHLQHIFSKLEIRSRRQLILMNAAELQPAGAVR
jgi:DNA-binding CsgD family transcriptional regulator